MKKYLLSLMLLIAAAYCFASGAQAKDIIRHSPGVESAKFFASETEGKWALVDITLSNGGYMSFSNVDYELTLKKTKLRDIGNYKIYCVRTTKDAILNNEKENAFYGLDKQTLSILLRAQNIQIQDITAQYDALYSFIAPLSTETKEERTDRFELPWVHPHFTSLPGCITYTINGTEYMEKIFARDVTREDAMW